MYTILAHGDLMEFLGRDYEVYNRRVNGRKGCLMKWMVFLCIVIIRVIKVEEYIGLW